MAMQFLVQTKMLLRMKGGVIKCTEARGARPTRPEWTVRKTSLSTAEVRLAPTGESNGYSQFIFGQVRTSSPHLSDDFMSLPQGIIPQGLNFFFGTQG